MNRQIVPALCFLLLASCGTKATSGGSAADSTVDTATQAADTVDVLGPDLGAGDSLASGDVTVDDDAPQVDAQPDVCADNDQDGHAAVACGGDDCNDADPSVHPGALEVCDGKDNDCNGKTDDVTAAQLAAGNFCGSCALQCTGSETCESGSCIDHKTCTDACTAGQTKCQDGCTTVACVVASGPLDCNSWGSATTTCPTGTGCNLGLCGPGGTCGKPKPPCMSDDYGTFVNQFSCASTSFTDQQTLQYCNGGGVSCVPGGLGMDGCPVLFNHGYSAGCMSGICTCEKIQ